LTDYTSSSEDDADDQDEEEAETDIDSCVEDYRRQGEETNEDNLRTISAGIANRVIN